MKPIKATISCVVDDETDRAVKRYCAENGRISEAAFLRQAIVEKLEKRDKDRLPA